VGSPARLVDDLRYQRQEASVSSRAAIGPDDEYAFLKLRYKKPGESQSRLIERPVTIADEAGRLDGAGEDMRFAVAVSAFGQKLRGSTFVADFDYRSIAKLAAGARGTDPFGYRNEFVTLVRLADALDQSQNGR
jgi:Ca-activated chloride channel family protein